LWLRVDTYNVEQAWEHNMSPRLHREIPLLSKTILARHERRTV
jgi:hypothetical protein